MFLFKKLPVKPWHISKSKFETFTFSINNLSIDTLSLKEFLRLSIKDWSLLISKFKLLIVSSFRGNIPSPKASIDNFKLVRGVLSS